MSRRRAHTGRVKVDFAVIERFAAEALKDAPLRVIGRDWALSRKSALHRCKNGTFTLCLIWRSAEGLSLTSTHRGLRLERS